MYTEPFGSKLMALSLMGMTLIILVTTKTFLAQVASPVNTGAVSNWHTLNVLRNR